MSGMVDDQERIRQALNRVDFERPGALATFNELKAKRKLTLKELKEAEDAGATPEMMEALRAQGPATPADYEAFAEAFRLQFVNRAPPATEGEHSRALAILRAKHDKGVMAIRTGAEIGYENPARIPTGSLAADFITNGGIPVGYITQLKGQEGLGKTFLALQTATQVLIRGGYVLWVAAERFDKDWARTCGCPVHYSEEEMRQADKGQHPKGLTREQMQLYNRIRPEGARFEIMVGRYGDDLLQAVCDAVTLNAWDLVVVDSIAVLKSEKNLDEKQIGDVTPGGSAYMINDFCARVEASFNSVEARNGRVLEEVHTCTTCKNTFTKKSEHKECPDSKVKPKFETQQTIGKPLRVAVVVINQLRDRGIMAPVPQAPGEPGGRGLRHLKGLEIELQSAVPQSTTYNGVARVYGKLVVMRVSKSKVGPPERSCVVELWTDTIPGVSEAGRYNPVVDLMGARFRDEKVPGMAELSGLVVYQQPWYILGEYKAKGLEAFLTYLGQNPDVMALLRQSVLTWIRQGAH